MLQPKHVQESREIQEESIFLLSVRGGQTREEEREMSKKNGEEVNPNLREN